MTKKAMNHHIREAETSTVLTKYQNNCAILKIVVACFLIIDQWINPLIVAALDKAAFNPKEVYAVMLIRSSKNALQCIILIALATVS